MIKTDEIILQSKEDSYAVLDAMKSLLNQYEQVTLADMLELTGITSNYFQTKFGWTDLTGVEVKPVKEGFILDLPPTKEL